MFADQVAIAVSNSEPVRHYFRGILWVLVAHSQSRFLCVTATSLYVPINKGILAVVVQFICFYLIAVPVSAVAAFTDTNYSITTKMAFCLATSPAAQVLISAFCLLYLHCKDWNVLAKLIKDRANTDKKNLQ